MFTKALTLFSGVFAFMVVALGAWTRLADAGLGCPDWPGCYGFITIPINQEDISLRKLKISKGVVITGISNKSPLQGLLNVNDIIIEAKKTPITKSSDLKNLIDKIVKQGDKNLLLSIVDKDNRRKYLGVKLK